MNIRFNFSLTTTMVCGILALLMVRASFWQYDRLQQKNIFIATLNARLQSPPVAIETLLDKMQHGELQELIHRRVLISGTYDFEHEMVLKNRRHKGIPGALVITPLTLGDGHTTILVNRGFIPIKDSYSLEKFRKQPTAQFIGLLKESMARKMLAPADPVISPTTPFQQYWLRVNIPEIQKQIKQPLLPLWVEVMQEGSSVHEVEKNIVTQSSIGREEMFFLPENNHAKIFSDEDIPHLNYPIPSYDTVVPPGRHQEYVYEWAAMAFLTLLIGIVLQLRRTPPQQTNA